MPNFELGKYAVYVIPAYAITAVVIAALVADTLLRAARWKREVEKREAARDAKKKA
jgi:heme exporter protein D